jgi:hypothetical protein
MESIALTKHGKRRFRSRIGHNSFLKTLEKVIKEGEFVQNTKNELKILKDKFLFVFDKKEESNKFVLITVLKEKAVSYTNYIEGKNFHVERKTNFRLKN